MKTLVIVGGGPAGLYLAIRLSQVIKEQALDFKLVVIEPQLNEYNRPGIVAKNVLELIEAHVALGNEVLKASDDSDSSIFISRLELALYKSAAAYKIQFVKASLIEIDKQGKLVLDNGQRLDCDYAFDCTGAKRKLLNAVNNHLPPNTGFTFSRVSDNPMKNHFVAYVTMDKTNAHLMVENTKREPLEKALGLQQLRQQFFWPEFVEPELSQRRYTSHDQVLFYLYFETPPNFSKVSQDQQKKWLAALIQLKTSHALQYEIAEDALKFGAFVVDPDEVNKPYLITSELPFITIPMGDAYIKPDFRLGMGIRSGVMRTDAWIKAFSEHLGDVPMALKQYEFLLQHPLKWHENMLLSEYRLAREKINNSLPKVKQLYIAALSQCKEDTDRLQLGEGLEDINIALASRHLANATHLFSITAEEKTTQQTVRRVRLSKLNTVLQPEALHECEKELLAAMELMPEHGKKVIIDKLFDLAMSYKDLAGRLFQSNQKADAKIYYKAAAKLLSTFFAKDQAVELAKIYSNMLIITKQEHNEQLKGIIAKPQQSYEKLEKYADLALKYLKNQDLTSPEIKKLHAKISFNYCEGILLHLDKELLKENVDKKVVSKRLETAEEIYDKLKKEGLLSSSEDTKIIPLMSKLKTSLLLLVDSSEKNENNPS